jgi:hypothetical protein
MPLLPKRTPLSRLSLRRHIRDAFLRSNSVNTAGHQGYAPLSHNMYNIFAKEDNTDTTDTTTTNIAALTMGSTIMGVQTATIPDSVANAINQLNTNLTALMNQMVVMSYANVPPPSNSTIPTTNPITHQSSAATFCHGCNGWIQSWKWRRWQGGVQQTGAWQTWGWA